MGLSGDSLIAFTCCGCRLWTDTYKGAILIVILTSFIGYTIDHHVFKLIWNSSRRTDMTRDIITTIDGTYQNIMVISTDVDKGAATDISLPGTTIDTATDVDNRLRLSRKA